NCIENEILLADSDSEGLFYAEFDMYSIRKYREKEMLGNTYRKVKAYKTLLDQSIHYPFIRKNQSR
ncbi:carbon-nitrogen hydrolase family protein, partial [Streptococcus pyogenes]